MKKLIVAFGIVFSSLFLFQAGLQAAHRNFSNSTVNVVTALFWMAITGFVIWDAVTDEFARIAEHRHDELAKEVFSSLDEALDKALANDTKVAEKPAEDDAEAPDTASKPRTQIHVVDGDAPAPKPPTKAQQRKANAKKGLGPLTDEEVREQRNEKRRAARAAKKLSMDTTTTTTQPGQRKLL